MNINKLQAQLQRVPDQALIGYVQNPDGQVPSFLALAELTRRKEMRKQAAPQQAAPTQTVAQQAVAQAEPGIAQLPVREDMFNEAAYASGGIVAFADGGEVPGFSDGSYAKYMEAWNRRQKQLSDPNVQTSWLERNVLEPLSYTALQAEAAKDIRNYDYGTPFTPRSANELKAIAEREKIADAIAAGKYDPTGKPLVPTVGGVANLPVKDTPTAPVVEVPNVKADLNTIKRTNIDPNQFTNKDATTVNAAGYEVPTVTAAKLEEPAGLSTLDALNQRRKAMTEAGVDTDFFQKQQEKLAAQQAALGGEKEKAGWMALARAGLGMAGGKSQFAVQNIAEGAMGGLDQYGRDAKEIKQDEKLLRQADQKLAEAKYMQDRGDADAAYNAMQKREDLINSTKIENVKLQQQANIAKAGLEGDRSKTMFTQAQENKRASEHNAIQRMIANKAPAEIALIDRYMTDPTFAASYDKMNAGKKELQSMQDMRELFIKAKKDDPVTYGDMTFSQFANSFSATGPAAKLPALDAKSASKYFK